MYLTKDVVKKIFTLILRFCQFYPTYPTKDVDNEFIHSEIQILSILSYVSEKRMLIKKIYSL